MTTSVTVENLAGIALFRCSEHGSTDAGALPCAHAADLLQSFPVGSIVPATADADRGSLPGQGRGPRAALGALIFTRRGVRAKAKRDDLAAYLDGGLDDRAADIADALLADELPAFERDRAVDLRPILTGQGIPLILLPDARLDSTIRFVDATLTPVAAAGTVLP